MVDEGEDGVAVVIALVEESTKINGVFIAMIIFQVLTNCLEGCIV